MEAEAMAKKRFHKNQGRKFMAAVKKSLSSYSISSVSEIEISGIVCAWTNRSDALQLGSRT